MIVDAFLDPANTLASIQAGASDAINEYLESTSPGHGKSPLWSIRTPGMHPFVQFPEGPVRGLFEINDRMFAVAGSSFAEVFADHSIGPLWDVGTDDQPVSMASNGSAGHQILIISAGLGYIYDLTADTLAAITAPDFPAPARQVEFMDGYFIVSYGGGSRRFSWSALEDGTSWDALDTAERSEAADNITSLIRNHREIWLIGFRTSEVWYDAGDVNNPFQPLQGVFIEHGGQGVFTPQRIDNTLIWMGLNDDGQGIIWRADGYTPQRVSTFAVEQDIQNASTPTDARSWVYQMNGHVFYVLILPRDIQWSWVYDVTMDRWHKWATWNPITCQWMPHVAGSHVFCFNKHLVGDRFSGAIYHLSDDYFDEEIVAA